MNYLIKEHIWEQIFVILSELPKIHLKDKSHLRLFIDAVFLMTDNNLKCRQLPQQYGNWFAIYQKFKRWSDKGIWEYLFSKVKKEPEFLKAVTMVVMSVFSRGLIFIATSPFQYHQDCLHSHLDH